MSAQKLTYHVIGGHAVFMPSRDRAPWVTNADNDQIRSPIVVPAEWSEVFSKNANPFTQHLSIFVGPKGVGKSTLLHLKRALVEGWVAGFAAPNNVVCLPSQEDALTLKSSNDQSIVIVPQSSEWKIFSKQEAWIALWKLFLATWVLQADFERRAKTAATFKLSENQAHHRSTGGKAEETSIPQIPLAVLNFFDRANQRIEPSDVVRCLNAGMRKKMTALEMTSLYDKEVFPLLRQYIGTTKYCMFVDAIDESLYSDEDLLINIIQRDWIASRKAQQKSSVEDQEDAALKTAHQTAEEGFQVWANAQAGLVHAAAGIFEDSLKKVRVYAPIRSEAFHVAARRVAEGQLTTCANVVYSRNRLETIVRLNMLIDLHKDGPQHITESTLLDAEKEFFGGREEYKAVDGTSRRWASEIVRLSMDRPRELMLIGMATCRAAMPDLSTKSPTQILAALHSTLPKIVDEFLRFIVGSEVTEHFETWVYPFIRANVLTIEDLHKVQDDVVAANPQLDHPMCKLYSLGLVGDVMQVQETGELIQRFRFSSAGNVMKPTSLPSDSHCYVVHPVLASRLQTVPTRPDGAPIAPYRRDEKALIGADLPWDPAPPAKPVLLRLRAFPEASTVEIDGRLVAGKPKPKHGAGARATRVATKHTRPHALLVAWLYTIDRIGSDSVTGDEIKKSMKTLQRERFIMLTSSRSKGPGGTPQTAQAWANETIDKMFEGLGDANDMVVDIRKFFEMQLQIEDGLRVHVDNQGHQVFASSVAGAENVTVVTVESRRAPKKLAAA